MLYFLIATIILSITSCSRNGYGCKGNSRIM